MSRSEPKRIRTAPTRNAEDQASENGLHPSSWAAENMSKPNESGRKRAAVSAFALWTLLVLCICIALVGTIALARPTAFMKSEFGPLALILVGATVGLLGCLIAMRRGRHIAKLSELLDQARGETEKERREKNLTLGTVSHELKTPLQTVLTSIDLLEDAGTLSSAELQQNSARLRRAAEALQDRLGDVLALARAESRPVESLVGLFSFAAVCFEAAKEAGTRLAQQKGLILEWFPPRQNWAVRGDAGGVRQVVHNLVTNACSYTSEGHVQVHIGELVRSAEEGRGMLRIDVVDTGPGIPETHRAALFRPFTKLSYGDQAQERKRKGGVGLAIVKALAERMGGRVEVESEAGKGSRFTVWIRTEPVAPWALKPCSEIKVGLYGMAEASAGIDAIVASVGAELVQVPLDRDLHRLGLDFLVDIVIAEVSALPAVQGKPGSQPNPPLLIGVTDDIAADPRRRGVDLLLTKPVSREALVRVLQDLSVDDVRKA